MRLSEVSVTVIGPGEHERAIREVIEAQDLKPGLRLNHGTYERVKGALLRAAKNDGYLDARLTKNDLVIDRQERRATATIEVDTGKRYSYGEINDRAGRHQRRLDAPAAAHAGRAIPTRSTRCCARSTCSTTASISRP